MFDQSILNTFENTVTDPITKIVTSPQKEYIHEKTCFGNDTEEHIQLMKNAFHVRQVQMKEGEIAQIALGSWHGWRDLGIGHETGLDIKKNDNSVIIELKNKYNTCNSGSQKSILDKLAGYKEKNPHTMCVWGIINPKPNTKSHTKKIIHNGQEIMKIQGDDLFKIVCEYNDYDYTKEVIDIVKKIMYNINTSV
jgi:hypothetical protein